MQKTFQIHTMDVVVDVTQQLEKFNVIVSISGREAATLQLPTQSVGGVYISEENVIADVSKIIFKGLLKIV